MPSRSFGRLLAVSGALTALLLLAACDSANKAQPQAAAPVMWTPPPAPVVPRRPVECDSLEAERASLDRDMRQLVANNPGIHIVIGICAAVGESRYRETKDSADAGIAFGLCAVTACAMTDMNGCMNVAERWFGFGIRGQQIAERVSALRC